MMPSAVRVDTVKLIDQVAPRKDPAWTGIFPLHGAQLETAGLAGREEGCLLQTHLLYLVAHPGALAQPTHSLFTARARGFTSLFKMEPKPTLTCS